MGWASSYAFLFKTQCVVIDDGCRADYVQGTRLSFRSKEDAIHFAEKQGKSPVSLSLKPTQDDGCVLPQVGTIMCKSRRTFTASLPSILS